MHIWENLPKPFFVLAPMDDVTDTVFRRVIAKCAAPDLFFTEFVSVDGLQSAGREKLLKKLQFTDLEKPIIAQIWGRDPENYYKTAKELVEMGFAGIDINLGCPDKTVIKNGCCIALINNRGLTGEIIQAVKEGSGTSLPISVKTRLGLKEVDLTWPEFLLKQTLNMLTIHGRTAGQLGDVPANWNMIGEIEKMRTSLAPSTLIVGNGDVKNRNQALELAKKYNLDGIMIGRGVFQDPFAFANQSPWGSYTKEQRINMYKKHVELFAATWKNGERGIHTLNKFCKIYINGFDGAKEFREKLMHANSTDELLDLLNAGKSAHQLAVQEI